MFDKGGRAVIVTPYTQSPVGHGGNHRSYQIRYDVEGAVGVANLRTFCLEDRPAPTQDRAPRRSIGRRVRDSVSFRWKVLTENPARVIVPTRFTAHAVLSPTLVAAYETCVAEFHPSVCICEHTLFEEIRRINQRVGIPTIICPHNLDSLSQNLSLWQAGDGATRQRWPAYAASIDLANEIDAFTRYDVALLISRMEVGLVGALGIDCRYYPYVPTGAIRRRCETIRARRETKAGEPGHFVLMGSAKHYPTRRSLEWFIDQVSHHGLPADVHVSVVGYDTETLAARDGLPTGLRLCGWLAQDELDDLLSVATAALVPQRMGFGSLTRLPELSCSGIPTLTSAYPTFAIDAPPGTYVVENDWESWRAAMLAHSEESKSVLATEYRGWEDRQPNPLTDALSRYAGASATK